jgi:hypothetical protein
MSSVFCILLHGRADASFLEAALLGQTCQVGAWGPYSACMRTAMNEWSQSRSRSVLQQGSKCPELVESMSCGECLMLRLVQCHSSMSAAHLVLCASM